MNNNQWLIDAIKGEPNSLTSIAFETGEVLERQRIIKLLEDNKHEEGRFIFVDYAIALIKGEDK